MLSDTETGLVVRNVHPRTPYFIPHYEPFIFYQTVNILNTVFSPFTVSLSFFVTPVPGKIERNTSTSQE